MSGEFRKYREERDAITSVLGTAKDDWLANRDGKRLLKLVPRDTRDLTARIAGDPLPGRSALDQRRQA